ncbi:ABC transporter ATP-binding protein, partial [Brachyspira hampsonii]|nr:ABC transporter ATP-binding protein [Brachyspira hampsonii]
IILSSHDIVSITKTDYIIKFSKYSNYKPIHKKDINKNELKDIFPDVNYDEILKDISSIIN